MTKAHLPRGLELGEAGAEDGSHSEEDEGEAASEGGVEVVGGPGDPVVAVVDVGVIVVPRPPQQLDAHDVKGDVN